MIHWGIIGPGRIASAFATAVAKGDSGRVLIACGRDPRRTREFAAAHGIPEAVITPNAVFQDPRINAVYIATPHPSHAALSLEALEAGKAVLCEKPMAIDFDDVTRVLDTARHRGKLFLEAFMYRYHPQTLRLTELLRERVIGEVNLIESAFGFAGEYDPDNRLFNPALGGGAIWDIGGYPLSMAMLAAGAALGQDPPAVPEFFQGCGVTAPGGIDLTSVAIARWEGRIAARIVCSLGASPDPALRIHGSEGCIVVPDPWVCHRTEPRNGCIEIHRRSGVEQIEIPATQTSYGYEADEFARLLQSGAQEGVYAPFSVNESREMNRLLCEWHRMVTGDGACT